MWLSVGGEDTWMYCGCVGCSAGTPPVRGESPGDWGALGGAAGGKVIILVLVVVVIVVMGGTGGATAGGSMLVVVVVVMAGGRWAGLTKGSHGSTQVVTLTSTSVQ